MSARRLRGLMIWLACGLASACGTDPPAFEFEHVRTYDRDAARITVPIEFSQRQDVAVVLSIHPFESEIVSTLSAGESPPFSTVHIPYLRIAPHFQVLEAPASERNVQLHLTPLNATLNARVRVDVFEIAGESRDLISAYTLFANALQRTSSESREVWEPRVAMLSEAAGKFGDLGMVEERLWAGFLQSYFSYFPLAEYDEAIRRSRQVHEEALALGFDQIALASLQNLAFTLLERNEGDTPAEAEQKQVEAQQVFGQAAELANELEMRFEEAWAINGQGIGFYYQDRHAQALDRYQQALPLARELQDPFFANMVRNNVALVQERLGREQDALNTFVETEASLSEVQDIGQLIDNLSEQGRILANLHQFSDSVSVLTRAMHLAEERRSADALGRILVNLARSYYEMGLFDRVLSILEEAEPVLIDTGNGRRLRELFSLRADIYRIQGNFEAMQVAREQQGDFLLSQTDEAYYAFYKAADLVARNADLPQAQKLLAHSAKLSDALHDLPLQQSLRFERCLNALRIPDVEDECDLARLHDDYVELAGSALPREALSGMEAWAEILARLGREAEAMQVFDDLVDRMTFYRLNLPGVLGAWYWERREAIFDAYMELALAADLANGTGIDSLLLFDRLRNLDIALPSAGGEDATLNEAQGAKFRSILARKKRAASPEDVEALEREYDRLLLETGQGEATAQVLMGRAELESRLSAMPPDRTLLAYYFGDHNAYAWRGDSAGVRVIRLSAGEGPGRRLGEVVSAVRLEDRRQLRTLVRELGEELLAPLGPVNATILLLPAGPLNGVPFDLLQFNDEPLGRNHSVVHLMSLAALDSDINVLPPPDSLFLAGDPAGELEGLPELSAAGGELDFVASLYPDAKITSATKSALNLDAFHGVEFREADFIHLASHSELDLAYPSLSTITLSDSPRAGSGFLTPVDFHGTSLSARLVVLSACETSGSSRFSYDGNLGFVTAFLSAGADAVVATLWPVSDRATAEFMRDFYTALAGGISAESALYTAKKQWIARDRSDQTMVWAAFQIYRN